MKTVCFEKIGVVILNYNSYKLTIRCIESIMNNCLANNLHYYVVDNASNDDSVQVLSERFKEERSVSIITNKKNEGYSCGNNKGMKMALLEGCEYIVVSNPDVYLLNDAISILINALKQNKNVCIAGPYLEQPNGLGQFARKPLTFKMAFYNKGVLRKVLGKDLVERNYAWNGKNAIVFSGMVAGCFFVARGEMINNMDGFDENFFLYYEEDVLAYKMKEKGYDCMIEPQALVYHDHGKITKEKGRAFIYYHYRISEYLLICKYTNPSVLEKSLLFIMNVGWFLLFCIRNKDGRGLVSRYIKMMKAIYHKKYMIGD